MYYVSDVCDYKGSFTVFDIVFFSAVTLWRTRLQELE